jgi:predicted RNA-binding protein associated with RNAse of E/G family
LSAIKSHGTREKTGLHRQSQGGNVMETAKLYRKRIIPEECIYLKDDIILYQDSEVIITKWNTLHPKKTLHHGFSCYFVDRGFKVSKFYDRDNQLISWYCDIISHTCDADSNTYVFTDLLVDVIIYPDGSVRVVDLDELADAMRDNLITEEQMQLALRRLDKLLNLIYKGAFPRLQKYIDDYDPAVPKETVSCTTGN